MLQPKSYKDSATPDLPPPFEVQQETRKQSAFATA
jgi:hypothetical protein